MGEQWGTATLEICLKWEDPIIWGNSSVQCCKSTGHRLVLLRKSVEPKLNLKEAFIIVIIIIIIHVRAPLGKSLSALKRT